MPSLGNSFGIPPNPGELEVSIFGPGFGETVVLHAGGGSWGVVDSCIDPASKEPAALGYLEMLGVPVESAVRFVVATHWHDDHIRGLGKTFRQSRQAVFACSAAVRSPEIEAALAMSHTTRMLPGGSGLDELREVLNVLRHRQPDGQMPAPRLASAGKVIWQEHRGIPARLTALAPSDASVWAAMAALQAKREISPNARRRIPSISPNDASVVLSLEAGAHSVLLGADLQVHRHRSLGWLAVVDGVPAACPHHGFKVPHHGSSNADHDEIWSRLLAPDPWAVTTPFVSGRHRLPSTEDRDRLLARTPHCYLTAPPEPAKYRDANSAVRRTVSEATRMAHFIPGKYGHVRLRKWVGAATDAPWQIELFGDAFKLAAS